MAFDFGSDIIVDAMRAANPAAVADAKARLANATSVRRATDRTAPEFKASINQSDSSASQKGSRADVMQKFEAVVLSTFVQAMMPKQASSVFGDGLAGDMWKAQMAEKISDQISANGGIGIAARLLSAYQKHGEKVESIAGVRDINTVVELSRSNDSAARIVQGTELDSMRRRDAIEG